MRTITVPEQTITEQIQSVQYQINAYVDILIGVGSIVDGEFSFSIPQQFDVIRIIDSSEVIDPVTEQVMKPAITDFTDLINQYPDGNFSTNDLWPYIDKIRARR